MSQYRHPRHQEQQRQQNEIPQEKPSTASGHARTALEKLRDVCKQRGVNGIKSIGRMFRIYDDDGSKSLNMEEWLSGLRDYGAFNTITGKSKTSAGSRLTKAEAEALFMVFDRDGSGTIIFDELLEHLRPPMTQRRMELIEQAFEKLDYTGDGIITIEDLAKCYNPSFHPKYKSGEYTEKQVFREFLDSYDGRGADPSQRRDGKVTKEEFINYYAGVSASIDQDVYFDFMMRQCWGL